MNRFASTGDTEDPCGVPRSRAWMVPSGSASGASSHRFTYSTTHRCSCVVFTSTALTIRLWSTESNDTPPYYRLRGPRRRGARVGERLAADRGGRGAADRAPGLAAAGGFPAGGSGVALGGVPRPGSGCGRLRGGSGRGAGDAAVLGQRAAG